ncbi:hypothetical protein WJX79_002467 [Trebouxia sp. C0005]
MRSSLCIQGQTYSDPGATAYDAVDGAITAVVVKGLSAVNTMVAGSYVVTYSAEDAAGNVGSATRTVTVVSPCTSPEHFCSSTCRCSTYTVCLSATSICGTATSSPAAADTTPPVITVLLNSLSVNATTSTGQLLVVTTVYVGTTYVDPGATATDNVDGDITSELSTFGVGAVDTSAPTVASAPYLITYDVSDSAGNAAVEGLREVVVACKSPTTTCTASDGTLFCSTSAGLCVESTTTTVTTATYPTIKLIGQAVLGVTQGTSYLACPTPQPTDVICDRGCSASDSLDGVLTARVQACSTSTSNVTRTLVVEPVCPLGETLCSNKVTCSVSGLCVSSTALALTVVTSPVITLINGTYLSSLVQVKQGHSYAACSTEQTPTSALLCELGATAISASDGNLTSKILACPPTSCLDLSCPGYLFTEQGIASCAVNTSAAVGTTFAVNFMVFDYSISSLNASVTRTISIIDPCDSGEYLCSDGTCSTVACDLRDALVQGPPGLTFVDYGNSTSVTTGYGVATSVPLLPCTSISDTSDCGAVSMDSTGKDISSSIIAVDVTPCSTNDVCPACDISFAAAGLCLPGAYLYLYRAKDSYSQLASNWRLVQVQQQYAVTFTLPLTLPAATLAAAQAQADILTATSNATVLAGAVSAGLISGDITDVAPAASGRRLLLQSSSNLVMNSSLVASSLNSALALSITAIDSSSASSSGGAQLTAYSLTTAAVNNDTLILSGLLANLTCVQAELYEMEAAMSVGVDPLWVVPYTTVADSYQELLDDFSASVEELQVQLSAISQAYEAEIATTISGSSSSAASQLSTSSASSTLTVVSGCARGDDGSVRVQFYVSAANITREIDGLLSSRRRLQSTPCSSTDGTSLAMNYTTTTVTVQTNSTTVYNTTNSTAADYTNQQLSRVVGWNSNQVVGGLLLQSTRKTVTKSCNRRFAKFTLDCTDTAVIYDAATGEVVVQANTTGGLLPYGVDAVFLQTSSVYDASLSKADFYNVSSTVDITPYIGTPYGFHARSMSGFQLGFPAVFDNRLSQNDSQRMLTVLTEGNYLDVNTAALTARLLTFNSELKVYGYARVDFTWDPSGSIDVVAHFQAVPDVTLSFSSSDSIDQTVMAAFVLLVLLTAAQAGIVAVTVWGRLEKATSVWKILLAAFGETWVVYDLAVLASMLICLITYSVYIQSLVDFQPQDTYQVYDSLGAAQARLLLPTKQDSSVDNASSISTYGEVPGAAGRWTLSDVNTGLDSMAAMYAAVNTMSNQIVLFTTLQGITMQMLILRLIRVLSAQKRLSILTSTAIKALPWILDVGYTVLAVSILVAVMGHILFGDFEVTMTTLPDSISGYFEVMFTQQVANYDQDLGVTTTGPMQMNWLLRSQAYAWYFLPPITSVLILWWFLRVIIVSSFKEEADAQKKKIGIHNDLAVLLAELCQNLAGAPSNALLVDLFLTAAPRKRKTNVWARLRGQQEQLTIQERQRQGILGIHMDSLKEHLDKQEMQKLLGEIVHRKGHQLDSPAVDLQVLTKVVLSRFGGLLHDWPDSYFKAQQSKGDGLAGIFKQAMGQHQIQKVTRTRSVLARLFPASQFAKLLGAEASAESAPPSASAGGERLGSVLNTALLLPRHSSYTALSMEEPNALPQPLEYPGAASEDPGEMVEDIRDPAEHHGRSSLPRDASLGQRLGAIVKGALSLPRQSSYMPVNGDQEVNDAAGGKSLTIQRELSLREKYGSSSRQSSQRNSSLSRHSSQRYSSLSKQSSHSFLNEMFEVASCQIVGTSSGSLSPSREPSLGVNGSPPDSEGSNEISVPVSPSKRRAPPRDATHPPDWVTRTLGRTSMHHRDGSASPKSRLGPSFSSTSVASDSEDQDSDSLPTWVNWPSLQPDSQSQAPQQAKADPEDCINPIVPILRPPPQLRKGQQQETPKAEAALPEALTPSRPSQLLKHMPTGAELDAKPAPPVATPKGQRLFDFWHQKARSMLRASQASGALNMPSSAQLAQHIQSASASSGPASGQPLQLETQAASLPLGSTEPAPHQQALTQSEPAQPLRTELHSDLGHVQPSTAAAGWYHQAPADEDCCEEHGATPAALVAELEAASRLVHHQSLQQAQLLEGLEHALSELKGPVVCLQSAETQPNLGPRGQPDGHTLRRRQSFNHGNDRLGLTVPPGAGWGPLRQAPGGGSVEEPSAAAALSVPEKGMASAMESGIVIEVSNLQSVQ